MNNEEIGGILKLALLNELSDDIDLLESTSNIDSEEFRQTSRRLRKRFVAALFRERHPEPIKQFNSKTTFAIWLCEERTAIKLDAREIASTLDITPELVGGLEGGRVRPWELTVDVCASLMHLTQLHFNALAVLVRNTASTVQMLGINSAQARCHSGNMSTSRGDAVSRALELFKAHNADPVRDEQAEDWLRSVRTYLFEIKSELVD